MAEFTLKVRRYKPEDREGPYWESFDVDLDPTLSVLDGLLQAKDRDDGSLAVRCSCRAAICGSCGVKINGQSTLACKTMLEEAQSYAESHAVAAQGADKTKGHGTNDKAGSSASPPGPAEIVVEPMGNMPVIKDLVTDMESTHWKKIRRVTPWLLPEGDPPEREYVVPPESMIDVTQSMACIQCGACVSACLSMEADPDFIGPAALAKAYRFVGDPRDAGHDADIDDANNGRRHELAFTKIIQRKGTLDEAMLQQESYAPGIKGKLMPKLGAIKSLVASLPTAARGIRTGKMRSLPKLIPGVHKKLPGDAQDHVKRIYEHAEEHGTEINLYIMGEEDVEPEPDEEELRPP